MVWSSKNETIDVLPAPKAPVTMSMNGWRKLSCRPSHWLANDRFDQEKRVHIKWEANLSALAPWNLLRQAFHPPSLDAQKKGSEGSMAAVWLIERRVANERMSSWYVSYVRSSMDTGVCAARFLRSDHLEARPALGCALARVGFGYSGGTTFARLGCESMHPHARDPAHDAGRSSAGAWATARGTLSGCTGRDDQM